MIMMSIQGRVNDVPQNGLSLMALINHRYNLIATKPTRIKRCHLCILWPKQREYY